MEITKELYAAHRGLSLASTQFLEFVSRCPACLQRSNFNTLLSDRRYEYFQSQPWPTFINQETKKKMKEAAVNVFNLIKTIPQRLFNYDVGKISRYYGFSEGDSTLMLYGVNHGHMRHLLGRGDFIFSPSAGFKCLEFNIQGNLGGWELDELEPLYINTPVISEFLEAYHLQLRKNKFFSILMDHLSASAREYFGDNIHGKVNAAIVFREYLKGLSKSQDSFLKELVNYLHQVKNKDVIGEVVFCGLNQLQVPENKVMLEDKPIHMMIQRFTGHVPLELMKVVKDGNLIIFNGQVSLLLTNKLNLALLSQHQDSDVFSPEEKEIIREHIPWTRKIIPGETTYGREKVNLENFILSNREQLVMKPGEGYGGHDVIVGFNTPAAQWKQQLEQVLSEKNWVVQEYVPSFPYLYQAGDEGCAAHHAVWGLFVFGCRYAGGFVRILPEKGNKGVINSHQGAEESIILEVDE
ncbi:MAG: hypothetical protein JSV88_33670 [Candidatus Aminicenantes bacterium]|nr:MAG: hypothetical protein JSV88_33670 [Candidatus Aminicenantes bacterium]